MSARDQTAQLHELAASKAHAGQAARGPRGGAQAAGRHGGRDAALLADQNSRVRPAPGTTRPSSPLPLAAQVAAEKKLDALIAKLVAAAIAKGGIPSIYNGTLAWPMSGRITQEFGCTGFWAEPPLGTAPTSTAASTSPTRWTRRSTPRVQARSSGPAGARTTPPGS